MIGRAAAVWGRWIGHYSRKVVSPTSVRLAREGNLPPSPVIWVGWHELNVVTIALHGLLRTRPALAFMPGGAKGAAVKTWLGEFGIVPVEVSGDASDGLALRRMHAGLAKGYDVIIAVDGPSGPRRQVRPGALWLAAVAGVPVMPIGCAAAPAFRFPRWDRHLVPLPGASIVAALGSPIATALDPKSAAAAQFLAKVLDDLMDRAAAMLASAGTGEPIGPPEQVAD